MDDHIDPEEHARAVAIAAEAEGARADANEARLHAAIEAQATGLATPALRRSRLFRSFFLGGFECSTHRRRDGARLDLLASTGHAAHAAEDYAALASHGIRTVRDGLRWHLIETSPGQYDWSSFLQTLRAGEATGTEVLWDLCHWGWPDWLDIWSDAFVDRFAAFAGAAARLVREETDVPPLWVPVNEISFWAWGGGSVGFMAPYGEGRGDELKAQLVRAAIAAIGAARAVDPRARILAAEPVIHIAPRSADPGDVAAAAAYTAAQFDALDMLTGRLAPELGGREDHLDAIGLNFYAHNQWIDGDLALAPGDPAYRPLRELLAGVWRRYGRPVFVAETGIEGETRAVWLRMAAAEVAAAQRAGVPVEGLCLYPVTDYPGWDDDRHCPTGLLGYLEAGGTRPVHAPLAREIATLQAATAPA